MFDNITYKIGGSCLTGDADYETVARFLIEETSDVPGPVPVVVSAQEGETDRLLREATVAFADDLWAQVDFAALEGDFHSAGKLVDVLHALGATAVLRSPWSLRIEASGDDPFCGRFVGLDPEAFARAVTGAESRFVVIPGYVVVHVSEQRGGRPALVALGRGASDLIGVEVARHHGGVLRLVKSAECIYAVSPDFVENPKPLTHMTHEQASRVLEYMRPKHQFIQARAVQHAKQHNVVIEFGSMATRGVYSRIDSTFQADEQALFRALPVREGVSLITVTLARGDAEQFFAAFSDAKHRLSFIDGRTRLTADGIEATVFVETPDADAAEARTAEFGGTPTRSDGTLLTLIDSSIEPEGEHFLRIHRALKGIPVLESSSSGIILHILVEGAYARSAARALAEEFDLLEKEEGGR